MAMSPVVVDISHHNKVTSLKAAYDYGIRGIIHKATQGSSMIDNRYHGRKEWAAENGFLWGAYHFADNSPVKAQVANFLATADADEHTLLALDFEPNNRRTMSLSQAKDFLTRAADQTGQRPLLYSGNLLKEQLGTKADAFISTHRLWICQYGPKVKYPPGFKKYWLWQYTGDGMGPTPHNVPGIGTGIDCNVFGGVDLEKEWVDRI